MKKITKNITKKRVKKPSISKLRKEVENLAKLVAKNRDNWTCQYCGKKVSGSDAHGSHIIPVSHGNSLRFDPKNIICLCYHHHLNWWHKNPLEASEWFKKTYPKELQDYIDERKNLVVKFSLNDYLQMKETLTISSKELQ